MHFDIRRNHLSPLRWLTVLQRMASFDVHVLLMIPPTDTPLTQTSWRRPTQSRVPTHVEILLNVRPDQTSISINININIRQREILHWIPRWSEKIKHIVGHAAYHCTDSTFSMPDVQHRGSIRYYDGSFPDERMSDSMVSRDERDKVT